LSRLFGGLVEGFSEGLFVWFDLWSRFRSLS
jgi:hypothetical protein